MKFKQNTGFSLIELMVVVAIIGILSVVGVPKYQIFKAKSIVAQATASLSEIHTFQQAFYMDNDTYAATIALTGYIPPVGGKYVYTLPITTPTTFTATATKTPAGVKFLSSCTFAGDIRTINETKTPGVTTNGLTDC